MTFFSVIRTQPSSVFVVNGSMLPQFGPNPVPMVCPNCRANVVTVVTRQPGTTSYLVAIILCLV